MLGHSADDIPLVEARVETYDKQLTEPGPDRTPRKMKRKIKGYDKDDAGDWRAKLECRHYQHVRHQPPLRTREWVLTAAGRASRLGMDLECRKCDEGAPTDFLLLVK